MESWCCVGICTRWRLFRVCPAGRIIGDRGGGIMEDAGRANMAGLFGPPEVFSAVMGDMGIMES